MQVYGTTSKTTQSENDGKVYNISVFLTHVYVVGHMGYRHVHFL